MLSRAKEPIQALFLLSQIEAKIKDSNNMIAVMVRTAIRDNVPAVKIIATLADMANDNIVAVTGLFGHSITYKIVTFITG